MRVFGNDYPTPDGTCIRDYIHVSDLIAAHCDALAYLRAGGASATLNCGYGRGFSVLEVIESVKRVSGVDFRVEFAGRRVGDPAQLVAACDRVRATLNWQPHFNDLQTIVSHALAWERKLSQRASCEKMACTRFRRHRVRCFDGAEGGSWSDGSLRGSSSLRRCA